MEDDFNRAAQKQRLQLRQGAQRALQKQQRQPATSQASTAASSSSAAGASASSSSSPPPPPPPAPAASHSADFKAAVAAAFKELVASGVPPQEAATKAILLVRQGATSTASAKEPVTDSGALSRPQAAEAQAAPEPGGHETAGEIVEEEICCPGGPFTCFICLEPKTAEERFLPHRCSVMPTTLCCRSCYAAWVESQIDSEAAEIRCCHCDINLGVAALTKLVSKEHWKKYCDVSLQRALRRDPNFIWCNKCSTGGWVDPCQPPSKCGWICPECDNSFVYCRFCRREHGTLACKRFQQLRHEIMFGKKAKDKESRDVVERNSKMCPSCKMPIQKEGGCNFMDCPNCRRHFCWSCGRILKASHQAHRCDAGFEGSKVLSRTPMGAPCVEITRLFTNVLNIDNIELMNADEVDLADVREMLVPGLSEEGRSPLFVGPSQCDGEVLLRIPFNFTKSMSWDLTHLMVRAVHPPAPQSYPPRSLALIPNRTSVTFSDFEDPTTVVVPLEDRGQGILVAPLEQFRSKGIFKRVTSLALRFSTSNPACSVDCETDDDAQVYFNDLALFGLPGDSSNPSARFHGGMFDERADLIVSPVLHKRRWGEEIDEADQGTGTAEAAIAEEEPDAGAGPPKHARGRGHDTDAEPAGGRILPEMPQAWDVAKANEVARRQTADRHRLMCATPGCNYLVHSRPEMGGYCCIACSEGGPHGPRCQRVVAPPGTQRAEQEWGTVDGQQLADMEYEEAIQQTSRRNGDTK